MKDLFSVQGKVIILTGGSGFLGSQFKRHLTSCGAKVVIFDNQEKNPVDITNPKDVKKAVDKTWKDYKRIDGLVHVAAINAVPGSETSKISGNPTRNIRWNSGKKNWMSILPPPILLRKPLHPL